ncbi:MAG: DUF4255 domain-containing protein [Cytophagales bacterium]|nr:DUF4255 domain-containing protein [Cytophagales bacterium]
MLDRCLNVILTEINSYIHTKGKEGDSSDDKVIVADLASQEGVGDSTRENKIIMSLVNISKEELGSNAKQYIPQGNGYIAKNPPLTFSLYILFSNYFKSRQLLEGLGYLSMVIAFFQSKNHFTVQNTPSLQENELDNISVELIELSAQEKSSLWGYLGVKYLPSVLYKVGIIPIEDDMFVKEVSTVEDIIIQ